MTAQAGRWVGKVRVWGHPVWDAPWPRYGSPFTRSPAWPIKMGVLADMPASYGMVYQGLCCTADNETAISYAKIGDLAKLAGVARSSVPEITAELERRSLILRRRFGNRQAYKLLTDPPEWLRRLGHLDRTRRRKPGSFNALEDQDSSTACPTNGNGQHSNLSRLGASVAFKPVPENQTDLSPGNPTILVPEIQTKAIPNWVTDGTAFSPGEDPRASVGV